MCTIILDKHTDPLNPRNFTQPRDTPVLAYKVFRMSSGLLKAIYNRFNFNIATANIDCKKSIILHPQVKRLCGDWDSFVGVEFPAGFFSYKTLADALKYCINLRPYYNVIVRKVLLLDVIGEYQSTAGEIYLSKILYIASEKDEQLYPMS